MQKILIGAKVDAEFKERLQAVAEERGQNMSDIITEALEAWSSLPLPLYRFMERQSKGRHEPVSAIAEAILIRRLAELAARRAVWGPSPEILPEFTRLDGELMKGEHLYNFLVNHFKQDEERERERILLEHEQWGLSPEDSAWLKARHKGRAWFESDEFKAAWNASEGVRERVQKAKDDGIISQDCKHSGTMICGLLDAYERGSCTIEDLREMLGKTRFGWVGDTEGDSE